MTDGWAILACQTAGYHLYRIPNHDGCYGISRRMRATVLKIYPVEGHDKRNVLFLVVLIRYCKLLRLVKVLKAGSATGSGLRIPG